MSEVYPVLIDGNWINQDQQSTFKAYDPTKGKDILGEFPISGWSECDQALEAATRAFEVLQGTCREKIADFLNTYAELIEKDAEVLSAMAAQETGLPQSPRLKDIELLRTTNQLRLAATAATDGSWSMPTIDSSANIRSMHRAIGPVVVFGPNNFPMAFNGISGGDFASAIAAGNPVIVKGHPNHPHTTRMLADLALKALRSSGLPLGTLSLIYHMPPEDGLRLVADDRAAATAFTGGRPAGMALKSACDTAGKPIYLELSSVNPVVILPGAVSQRSKEIAAEFSGSCMMAAGQFCTNPGMVLMLESPETEAFIQDVVQQFRCAAGGTLLSPGVKAGLQQNIPVVCEAGAELLTGGQATSDGRLSFDNSVLRASGDAFLKNPVELQTEMFGPACLLVVVKDADQAKQVLEALEGNLTGTIYSSTGDLDDALYSLLEPVLRKKVGRLTNDKMPTGVAVSSAMNHGGPFPSTGHAGFSSVGMPGTLRRFTALQCYDAVRQDRLPCLLKDENPNEKTWRLLDGQWSQANVSS